MDVVDCGANDLLLVEADQELSQALIARILSMCEDWTRRSVLVVEPGLRLTLLRNGREALRVRHVDERPDNP